MRLYRIIIPIQNLDKAIRFYTSVLGIEGHFVSPGRYYLNLSGMVIVLYNPERDGDPIADTWKFHENQYIYISVDDLPEMRKKCVQNGGKNVIEIDRMPWGEKLFYLSDPEGIPLCFVEKGTEFLG